MVFFSVDRELKVAKTTQIITIRNRQNENKSNKKMQNKLKIVDEEEPSSRSSINVIGTSNQEHSGGDMSIINIIKSIKWSVDL